MENMAQATALSDRLPTPDEARIASEAVTAMSRVLASSNALPMIIEEDSHGIEIELPAAIGYLVLELLDQIARGKMVTFVPYGAELTTQAAADILNVSRPFLISLLESGGIDHHRVGTHRRVKAEDLFAYKNRRDADRAQAMDELQQLGEEFDAA